MKKDLNQLSDEAAAMPLDWMGRFLVIHHGFVYGKAKHQHCTRPGSQLLSTIIIAIGCDWLPLTKAFCYICFGMRTLVKSYDCSRRNGDGCCVLCGKWVRLQSRTRKQQGGKPTHEIRYRYCSQSWQFMFVFIFQLDYWYVKINMIASHVYNKNH